jgi:hypothetical protein
LDTCPEPKSGLVVQPLGGEAVIYDPEADALHRLEPTAAAVWHRLGAGRSVRAIAVEVAASYGVPEATVRDDVLGLVGILRDQGLLAGTVAAPSSTSRQPAGLPSGEFDLGNQPLPAVAHVTRTFRGVEHSFEVATNVPAVRDYLDEILADLSDRGDGPRARYELMKLPEARFLVRYEDQVVVATGRLDRALAVLLWHVNAEVVRRSTLRYPLVHAAAATRNGSAILLPAAPESGKTTTVAGLVDKAGFEYLTDEAVAIDPDSLRAMPYPKPLSIDRGSWDVLAHLRPPQADRVTGQWQVRASSIRPGAVAGAAPIQVVVEPAYDPGATTHLEPVAPVAMLVRLADSTFNFHTAPQRNLEVLARVVEQSDCYRLPISDLDEGVRLIESLFSASRPA